MVQFSCYCSGDLSYCCFITVETGHYYYSRDLWLLQYAYYRPVIVIIVVKTYNRYYRRDLDEVLEQKAELDRQLSARLTQNAELEASVTELRGKLELSHAYIQQLSGSSDGGGHEGDNSLYSQQICELQAQNSQLHENVARVRNVTLTSSSRFVL